MDAFTDPARASRWSSASVTRKMAAQYFHCGENNVWPAKWWLVFEWGISKTTVRSIGSIELFFFFFLKNPGRRMKVQREDDALIMEVITKIAGFRSILISWLVVWNIFYFPINIGNNHPNWLSYFSEGFKPPTRYDVLVFVPWNLVLWYWYSLWYPRSTHAWVIILSSIKCLGLRFVSGELEV